MTDRARSEQPFDIVERPEHYNMGRFEVIDVILDWKLGFCLGNAIKYIARAGKKDRDKELEDLKKARFYLQRQIMDLESAQGTTSDAAP